MAGARSADGRGLIARGFPNLVRAGHSEPREEPKLKPGRVRPSRGPCLIGPQTRPRTFTAVRRQHRFEKTPSTALVAELSFKTAALARVDANTCAAVETSRSTPV